MAGRSNIILRKKAAMETIGETTARIREYLGLPAPEPIDPRADKGWDGALGLEQLGETLALAADALQAQHAEGVAA